ncbi:TrbC/VirB2 family protein [Brevundimonas sp.]|uniref:TrbC/VirB2 family protein n=1 Tax=Brevundimonas sp. TaxID=1871086 RepID=UPI003D6D303E
MIKLLRGIWRTITTATATAAPAIAHAQTTLADPRGSGPIVSAVQWLQGTLLGTIATVVAVIAVACVGLLMLSGRINWRHGAVVILGCFILFGAASIVAGIRSTAGVIG